MIVLVAMLLVASQPLKSTGPALFVGDSITRNWNTDLSIGQTVNAGMPGQDIHRIRKEALRQIQTLRPGFVHVMAGTNDYLDEHKFRTARKVLAVAFAARAIGAQVVVGTIPPSSSQRPTLAPAEVAGYNRLLKAMATLCGFTVADYYTAMLTHDGRFRPELFLDDVHPNEQGYAVMRRVLAEARHQ